VVGFSVPLMQVTIPLLWLLSTSYNCSQVLSEIFAKCMSVSLNSHSGEALGLISVRLCSTGEII
jgi:hypothetical protein